MKYLSELLDPSKVSKWDRAIYFITFVPPLLLLVVIGVQSFVPVAYLTKDMLAVAELAKDDCCHVYFGLVSNLGIILWCFATAICLFAALLLGLNKGEKSDIAFLTSAGLFTGWLMLDDFFLVHEDVLPAFGVPELATYSFYAGLAVLYFWYSWKKIINIRPVLMFLALLFLGSSVVIDVVWHSESTWRIMSEDGAKLLGITAWCVFHIEAAFKVLSHKFFRAGGSGGTDQGLEAR